MKETESQEQLQVQVVLASSSPRRRDLLEQAGVEFLIQTAQVDESLEPDDLRFPEEACKKLAERKARAVVEALLLDPATQGTFAVIGADTMVVCDNEIFGKPHSCDHAFQMLSKLQGRTHSVVTAVSVWLFSLVGEEDVSLGFRTFADVSHVTFKELEDADLYDYIATGESFDKAGAYAAQGKGACLIERISGNVSTVIGLPVERLLNEFPFLRPNV